MIRILCGTVQAFDGKEIILLTPSGVGYGVHPGGALLAEATPDRDITILISTQVREDSITLYGFITREELLLFEKLITVSGIGPKVALQILSVPMESLLQALEEGDVAFLQRVNGIGKKGAQKLIMELQGKLVLDTPTTHTKSPQMQEAEQALKQLGYEGAPVREVLEKAPEDSTTEQLVKYFLSNRL